MENATLSGGRQVKSLQQEKAQKTPTLAAEKYQRKLSDLGLKKNTILEPYQLKAQGLSGY